MKVQPTALAPNLLAGDCFHEDDLITNLNENLNALIGSQISGHKLQAITFWPLFHLFHSDLVFTSFASVFRNPCDWMKNLNSTGIRELSMTDTTSHSSFCWYPSIHPASLHHRDFHPPVVVHYSKTNPSWRVQMSFSHLSQQSDFTFHHSNGYLERCSSLHGPLVYAKGLCRWVWNLLNYLSISRNLLCVLRKWSIWPHYYSTELPIAIWLQGKNSGKWHK